MRVNVEQAVDSQERKKEISFDRQTLDEVTLIKAKDRFNEINSDICKLIIKGIRSTT